jgi:hypothetical protein
MSSLQPLARQGAIAFNVGSGQPIDYISFQGLLLDSVGAIYATESAPSYYANGFGFSQGRLCVVSGGTVDHYSNGVGVSEVGQVVLASGPVTHYSNGVPCGAGGGVAPSGTPPVGGTFTAGESIDGPNTYRGYNRLPPPSLAGTIGDMTPNTYITQTWLNLTVVQNSTSGFYAATLLVSTDFPNPRLAEDIVTRIDGVDWFWSYDVNPGLYVADDATGDLQGYAGQLFAALQIGTPVSFDMKFGSVRNLESFGPDFGDDFNE